MRRTIQVLAACVSALPLLAHSVDFELKGIKLGEQHHGGGGKTTLAGADADVHFGWDKSGKVDIVIGFFESKDFLSVSEAVTAKYGKPNDVQQEPMVNGLGAHFTKVTATWINDKGDQMMLTNVVTKATQSAIELRTKAKIEAENAQATKAKRDI